MFVWDAQKQPAGVGIVTQDVTVIYLGVFGICLVNSKLQDFKEFKMDKQDLYTLCTLIPPMDDYRGYNMYLCGKRDGFNECVQMLKENLENVKEEAGV